MFHIVHTSNSIDSSSMPIDIKMAKINEEKF